jgi:hypothetical protein
MATAVRVPEDDIRAWREVKDAVARHRSLLSEDFGSLTGALGEIEVCTRFGYLRASSTDEICDGIPPEREGEDVREFDPRDLKLLEAQAIQIKSSRIKPNRSSCNMTGDVRHLTFRYLYAVLFEPNFEVRAIYRLTREEVHTIQQSRMAKANKLKLPWTKIMSDPRRRLFPED